MQRLSVENARKTFGEVLKKAADEKLHTVVTRHGADMGVVVPVEDYRRYRQLDGDPTEM
ncbi:type II toxin-antitoxin system Phd/YefM family antitoxin [Micromonospora tulbaghiae]|uniref:type II toxin-antitoxin system Phd/YefM family antitoxin n=1 Tax=Micromonospora tulbaghiae TaxID=479978 RepID=UPI0033E8D39E